MAVVTQSINMRHLRSGWRVSQSSAEPSEGRSTRLTPKHWMTPARRLSWLQPPVANLCQMMCVMKAESISWFPLVPSVFGGPNQICKWEAERERERGRWAWGAVSDCNLSVYTLLALRTVVILKWLRKKNPRWFHAVWAAESCWGWWAPMAHFHHSVTCKAQSIDVRVQKGAGPSKAPKPEHGAQEEEWQDFARDLIGNWLLDNMSAVILHT